MTRVQFADRVCRQDERAEDDFSMLCRREAPQHQVTTESVDGVGQLRDEYLNATMTPGKHYSLHTEKSGVDAQGEPFKEVQAKHFHFLSVSTGHARPKQMPTAEATENVALKAHLALQIVTEEPWASTGEVDLSADVQHVFPVGHPTWVRPEELGEVDSWYRFLYRWEPSPGEHDGTICLRNKTLVQNEYSPLDDRCPTVAIAWYLKRHGWTPSARRVVHDSLAVGPFDSAEAAKMKTYYQVLTKLHRCLPLTSSIPFREPIHFYKCLLAGMATEPGLPSVDYVAKWNGREVQAGRDPDPLPPPEDDVPPLEDAGNDDVAAPLNSGEPQPKKKTRTGPSLVTPRRPGVGGGGWRGCV